MIIGKPPFETSDVKATYKRLVAHRQPMPALEAHKAGSKIMKSCQGDVVAAVGLPWRLRPRQPSIAPVPVFPQVALPLSIHHTPPNPVHLVHRSIKENDYGFPDGVPISNDARDLIQRILQPNPAMRPTLDQIACHPFFTSPRMYVPLSLPVTALQGPPQLLFHDVVPGRTQVDHMLRQPLGGLIMRSRSLQPASQNENAAPGNYDQPQMLPVPPLARTHSAPADVYRPGPQQQQQQQQQYYQNHYGGAGSSASSAASGAYDKENDGMSTGTGMGPRGKASASIASSSATGAGVESVAPGDMAQLMHMDSAGQYTNGGESVSMSGLDTPMSQTNGGAGGNWLNGLQSAPSSRAPSVLGNATSSAYNGENIYLRNGKVVGSSAVAGAASNDHGTGASAPKRAALGAIGQSGPVAGAALSSGRSASAAAGAGGGFGYTGAAAAASHGTRQATATAGGMHVAGSTAPINAHRPISAAVAPPTLPSSAAASSSTGNGSYKPFAAFQDTVGAGGAQRQALGSAGSTDGFGRQQVQQTYNLRSNSTANQMDVDSSGAPAPQQQHHQQQQSAFRSVAQAASVPLPSSAAATPAPSSGSLNDTMRNIFENLQIASVASTAPANPFSSTVQQRGGYASAVSAVGRRTSTPGGHMVMSPAAGQGHAAAAGGSPGAEAPIQPPTVWITQFLDYTSKYGFGYLMSNGAVGVYFNDATKILISSDGNNFEYIERQSAAGNAVIPGATYITGVDGQPRIVGSVLSYPEAMKKKVTLVKYFRTYLLEQYQRRRLLGEGRITQEEVAATSSGLFAGAATSGDANQATYVPLPTCREEEILMSQGTAGWSDGSVPFVKKWSRTRRSSIMRLSNQTMQISFYDGTSLIIQPDGSSASYINITGEILHLNVISVLIAAGSSGGWNGGSSGSSMISNGTAMSTGSRVALGGMGSPSAMMVDGTPTPALSLDVTVNIAKKINYTRALLQQLLYPQTQGPAAPAAR